MQQKKYNNSDIFSLCLSYKEAGKFVENDSQLCDGKRNHPAHAIHKRQTLV